MPALTNNPGVSDLSFLPAQRLFIPTNPCTANNGGVTPFLQHRAWVKRPWQFSKPAGEFPEILSACSQWDQQQPGEHLVTLCLSHAVQPPGRWLWDRGVQKPFFSALWDHFSSSMPGLTNDSGGGMWLLHFVHCYLYITAVKSINLFISLADLSWLYVLLTEMLFCVFMLFCICDLSFVFIYLFFFF